MSTRRSNNLSHKLSNFYSKENSCLSSISQDKSRQSKVSTKVKQFKTTNDQHTPRDKKTYAVFVDTDSNSMLDELS